MTASGTEASGMKAVTERIGCRQVLLLLLIGCNYAIVAINHTLPTFQGYTPNYFCQVDNVSADVKGCVKELNSSVIHDGTSCPRGYLFESERNDWTVVTEWQLVCERRFLRPLLATLYFCGVTLGAVACGLLADRYGRRPVILICLYAQGVLGASLYFVQTLESFMALRFIQGFFVQGLQGTTFALLVEIFPPRFRTAVGVVLELYWALGLVYLAGASYFIPQWRPLELVLSVPTAATLLYVCLVPESARWLTARGQTEEAQKVWNRILPDNKKVRNSMRRNLVTKELECSVESAQNVNGNARQISNDIELNGIQKINGKLEDLNGGKGLAVDNVHIAESNSNEQLHCNDHEKKTGSNDDCSENYRSNVTEMSRSVISKNDFSGKESVGSAEVRKSVNDTDNELKENRNSINSDVTVSDEEFQTAKSSDNTQNFTSSSSYVTNSNSITGGFESQCNINTLNSPNNIETTAKDGRCSKEKGLNYVWSQTLQDLDSDEEGIAGGKRVESVNLKNVGGRSDKNSAIVNTSNNVELGVETIETVVNYDSVVIHNNSENNCKIVEKIGMNRNNVEKRKATNRSGFMELFRNGILRKYNLIMVYVWFSVSLSYYGIMFHLPDLSGERHLNFLLGAILEVISYVLAYIVLSRFGRRVPMASYLLISGIICIVVGAVSVIPKEDAFWIGPTQTALALFGKGAVVSGFCTMFLYASELFPTVLRAAAMGHCGFWGRVGSLIAPQLLFLGEYTQTAVPFVIMGVLGMLAGLFVFALPETLGQQLPDTVEDVELRVKNKHLH